MELVDPTADPVLEVDPVSQGAGRGSAFGSSFANRQFEIMVELKALRSAATVEFPGHSLKQ